MAASLIIVCGMRFEAALAAGTDVVTVCGPGARRVAEGLERLLARPLEPAQGWAGVLSFGCAAGIDPSLAPGACVVASGVWTAAGPITVDGAWSAALLGRLPQATAGLLGGLDAPITAATAKARLWRESGVRACDMESHAAALAARRHGLPFAACRVVLDPAWRSLPGCALAALRDDGSTDARALLRALAAAPREAGPLASLAIDAWHARRALRRVCGQMGGRLMPPR